MKERDFHLFRKGEVDITVFCSFCKRAEVTGYKAPPYAGFFFLIPDDWAERRGRLWCGKCDPEVKE